MTYISPNIHTYACQFSLNDKLRQEHHNMCKTGLEQRANIVINRKKVAEDDDSTFFVFSHALSVLLLLSILIIIIISNSCIAVSTIQPSYEQKTLHYYLQATEPYGGKQCWLEMLLQQKRESDA